MVSRVFPSVVCRTGLLLDKWCNVWVAAQVVTRECEGYGSLWVIVLGYWWWGILMDCLVDDSLGCVGVMVSYCDRGCTTIGTGLYRVGYSCGMVHCLIMGVSGG